MPEGNNEAKGGLRFTHAYPMNRRRWGVVTQLLNAIEENEWVASMPFTSLSSSYGGKRRMSREVLALLEQVVRDLDGTIIMDGPWQATIGDYREELSKHLGSDARFLDRGHEEKIKGIIEQLDKLEKDGSEGARKLKEVQAGTADDWLKEAFDKVYQEEVK